MKMVVGLGNPGARYANTRHNVGFRVIDELARRWGVETSQRRFEAAFGSGLIRGERALLLKPQTFMNLSGRAVREAAAFHKLPLERLLVVLDDMALPLGRLRIRPSGSAGGHNGLASVIEELGSEEFARLRIGIGAVGGERMVEHVLSPFLPAEEAVVEKVLSRAADAVECWVAEGCQAAMNAFNRPEEAG